MKKAVINTRAKVKLENFSLASITAQTLSCKKYAEKNDIKVVGYYSDVLLFGAKADFPAWKALLHKGNPKFDIILVYDYSRTGRKLKQAYKDCQILQKKAIRLVSVTESALDAETENFYFNNLNENLNVDKNLKIGIYARFATKEQLNSPTRRDTE